MIFRTWALFSGIKDKNGDVSRGYSESPHVQSLLTIGYARKKNLNFRGQKLRTRFSLAPEQLARWKGALTIELRFCDSLTAGKIHALPVRLTI